MAVEGLHILGGAPLAPPRERGAEASGRWRGENLEGGEPRQAVRPAWGLFPFLTFPVNAVPDQEVPHVQVQRAHHLVLEGGVEIAVAEG